MPTSGRREYAMTSVEMLVLLSGPVAVGKTTLRQLLLMQYGFEYVRSSAYLLELAAKQGGSVGRSSLQEIGDELDKTTDYRWVVDAVAIPAMAANPAQRRWLVDAVRKERQVAHFRAQFGAAVLHVHLTASESVLRQRYEGRARALGDAGDVTSYEVAIAHSNEVASRGLISHADLAIDMEIVTPGDAARLVMNRPGF